MVGIDDVLNKLTTVIDPDLKKDIVSMGMIKDLELNSGNLKFTLELTTPACPFNEEIEQDVRKAIDELDGIDKFDMKVTAKVVEGRDLAADEVLSTVKNIIAVASGKGGVGKSTVSLNLALALSKTGAKVGVLDADIYGPSIPLMLGMKNAAMQVKRNDAGVDLLQPVETYGIKVISFGFFAQQDHQAAIYRGPIISGILKQFLTQADWSNLDYLIVDLPPGTGDIPLTLAQTIPITGILVVTTPQEVASNVASKAIGMFDKLNVSLLGVVENMSHFECSKCSEKHYIFGKGGAQKISEKHNIPFLGEIPLNSVIMEGSDSGKPVMITQPDSPSAEAFTVAAKNIAAQCSIQHYKMKEEAEAEAKWDRLSSEERQKILVELRDTTTTLDHVDVTPEHENKTWAELEQEIQAAIIQHLFGESKVQTTPTVN
jgi:ATP-binding protein involved in chromosome partitioning